MQIKIFYLPIAATEEAMEEINHFLRSQRIVDIKKELAAIDGNSCWTFCVTYLEQNRTGDTADSSRPKGKVDYMKVLDPATFDKFAQLRKIRKQIAEKEAIPAYVIFTDQELAELAKLSELTPQSMTEVAGIGKGKVEKYGPLFCQTKENDTLKTDDNEETMPF